MKDVWGKELIEGRSIVHLSCRKTGVYLVTKINYCAGEIELDKVAKKPPFESMGNRKGVMSITPTNTVTTYAVLDEKRKTADDVLPKIYTVEELKATPMVYSVNIVNELENIQMRMSPENISCDGTCSRTQIELKRKNLITKWRILENYLGVTVSMNY